MASSSASPSSSDGRAVRLLITYDGTAFHGWQAQRDPVRTVAGVLQEHLSEIAGGAVEVQGASRTDAGVHALGQVALFRDLRGLPDRGWFHHLNHALPPDVRVRAVQTVDDAFHPRHDAAGKRYVYRLVESRWAWPLEQRSSWAVREPLEAEPMRQAAALLLGEHDFSSFRASGCQAASPIRRLDAVDLVEAGPGRWRIEVRGSSFLKYMVRNLVGALVEVGCGRQPPEWMGETLAARDRRAAARTAPPQGLVLETIHYPGYAWTGAAVDDLDPPEGVCRPGLRAGTAASRRARIRLGEPPSHRS